VLEAVQHPDADRLRVCKVMTNGGEKQIVCGAPNARAGITVVLSQARRLCARHRRDAGGWQDPRRGSMA
jgi:hypothetical protein